MNRFDLYDGGRRGTASGEKSCERYLKFICGYRLDEFVRNNVKRNKNCDCFTGLSCRTHPRTEQSTVRSFLMVCMLRPVCDRLGGRNTANQEDAEDQETGEGTFDRQMFHKASDTNGPASRWYCSAQGESILP